MTAVGQLETFPALSRMSVPGGRADVPVTRPGSLLVARTDLRACVENLNSSKAGYTDIPVAGQGAFVYNRFDDRVVWER